MRLFLSLSLFLLGVGLAGCTAGPTQPATTATASIPAATSLPPTITPIPPTPTQTATPTRTPLPTFTPVPTPMPGGLYVDAAKNLGKISPYVFGTNHGPWATVTVDLMPEFLASGVTLIRFPGGNWGDNYDLDAFQIDMFMNLARQINAEPLFCVRLLGGSPEKAVAILNYTREQKYNVRYWSIGNEPSLYAARKPEWNTEHYNAEWRKIALALRAIDPTIILVGPDTNQFTGTPDIDPKDAQGRDWLREFLKANGDLVDVIAVHRYPFPKQKNERATRDQLFGDAPSWDSIVANLRATVREETGRDLPVGITEFNSSWSGTMGGDAGMDTFNNALWLTDVLGRLIRQRVDLVAVFSLQSNANVGGYGLLERYNVRPTYYAYQMWKRFGNELVYASSDDPKISIYAARKDNALTLMLVNRTDKPQTRTITLDHLVPGSKAAVHLFDETHKAEEQPAIAVSPKFSYTLPPMSATLLTIPGQ